jgi:hypothetical protein
MPVEIKITRSDGSKISGIMERVGVGRYELRDAFDYSEVDTDIHRRAFQQSMSRLAAAGFVMGRHWTATSAAIQSIAAAERRVLQRRREAAEQASVLAIYDRFL